MEENYIGYEPDDMYKQLVEIDIPDLQERKKMRVLQTAYIRRFIGSYSITLCLFGYHFQIIYPMIVQGGFFARFESKTVPTNFPYILGHVFHIASQATETVMKLREMCFAAECLKVTDIRSLMNRVKNWIGDLCAINDDLIPHYEKLADQHGDPLLQIRINGRYAKSPISWYEIVSGIAEGTKDIEHRAFFMDMLNKLKQELPDEDDWEL